jgi:hypothetical protein
MNKQSEDIGRNAAALPDDPIRQDSDDYLNRREFANAMAGLITAADADASLRIGIYGSWGEGKTSVLELMRVKLKQEGHACVFLTSWAAESRQALLERLLVEIARELDIRIWAAARQWAKPLHKAMKTARSAVTLDPRIKAADAVLGDAIEEVFGAALRKAADQQTQIVLQAINEKLGDRKLIVFVDDVDRVRPQLVPELLLTLREALNQPKYFYVMALAPEIVEAGLKDIQKEWGEPATFLEKIVELPRYLPAISDEQRDSFIRQQLARLTSPPDEDVLLSLGRLLPKNPRKLKLLLRILASVAAESHRYRADEVQWDVFYLVQLLRVEFPLESTHIVEDAEALKDFEHGYFMERMSDAAETSQSRKAYEKYLPADGPRRLRFEALCEGLRARPRWHGLYSLRELFLLSDEPPRFTLKEAEAILARFRAASAGNEATVLNEEVNATSGESRRRAKELFLILLQLRELTMSTAIDQPTEAEVSRGLAEVKSLTQMLRLLAGTHGVFRDGDGGEQQWEKVVSQIQQWAHFEDEHYAETRQDERELLSFLLENASDLTRNAIANAWRRAPRPFDRPRLNEHLAMLYEREERRLARHFINRLSTADALAPLYGDEMRCLRRVVFNGSSVMYTDTVLREDFLNVAGTAKDSLEVQMNFERLLGMADYGAFGSGAGTFEPQGCRALLGDPEIVGALWKAATARPLQRRFAGNLLLHRNNLVSAGIPEVVVPLPRWMEVFRESDNGQLSPAT